jgi:hypothetical protein
MPESANCPCNATAAFSRTSRGKPRPAHETPDEADRRLPRLRNELRTGGEQRPAPHPGVCARAGDRLRACMQRPAIRDCGMPISVEHQALPVPGAPGSERRRK